MEWLSEWWSGLDIFMQVLYCIALPSTLVLIIQTVMIIAGFGHAGPDMNLSDTSGLDLSGADSFDLDAGGFDGADGGMVGADGADPSADTGGVNPSDAEAMHLFTFQGIITFLCVFAWAGIVAYMASGNVIIAFLTGFVLGGAAMFGVAKIIQVSAKLAQNGNIVIRNYLGETGTVYIPIPADGKGHGKVNIYLGERYVEFDAVTERGETLASGTAVRVVDIVSGDTLVVEKAK